MTTFKSFYKVESLLKSPALEQIAGSASTSTVSTWTIDAADGWATPTAGNMIIIIETTRTGSWVAEVPAGYTQLFNYVDSDTSNCFYKISDGTESSVTVSMDGGSLARYIGMHVYEISNAGSISQFGTALNPTATLTGTAAGSLIIAWAWVYSASAINWTTGETLLLHSGGTTACSSATKGGGGDITSSTDNGTSGHRVLLEVIG